MAVVGTTNVVVVLTLAFPVAQGAPVVTTTCEAPAVKRGETGLVTCNYGTDDLPESYSLELFPATDPDTADEVVECFVIDNVSSCNINPGYSHNKTFGRQVVFQFLNASEANEGQYACQIIPRVGSGLADGCQFQLKGDSTHKAGGNSIGTIIGVAVPASLVLVVIVVGAAVCLQRKGLLPCTKKNQQGKYKKTKSSREREPAANEGACKLIDQEVTAGSRETEDAVNEKSLMLSQQSGTPDRDGTPASRENGASGDRPTTNLTPVRGMGTQDAEGRVAAEVHEPKSEKTAGNVRPGSKPEHDESRMKGPATEKASALGTEYDQHTGEHRTENGTKEHTQGKHGQGQGREHGEGRNQTQGPAINGQNKETKEAERDEGQVPEGEGRGVGEESERERRETSADDNAGLQQSCAIDKEEETGKQHKEGDEEGKERDEEGKAGGGKEGDEEGKGEVSQTVGGGEATEEGTGEKERGEGKETKEDDEDVSERFGGNETEEAEKDEVEKEEEDNDDGDGQGDGEDQVWKDQGKHDEQ